MSSYIKFASLAEKAGFPNVIDAEKAFSFRFGVEEGKFATPEVQKVPGRIQTWNKERTELWQASPELYAANRRSPYLGWDKFRPHILRGFEIYSQTAKPKSATALVLTYINQIEVEKNNKPSDYVVFLPEEMPYADNTLDFSRHTEQSFRDGDKIAILAGKNKAPESSLNSVVLTIIYTAIEPKIDVTNFKARIDKGHGRIIDAFEQSISDLQRKEMEVYG